MSALWAMILAQAAAATTAPAGATLPLDLSDGPVTTTGVAVTVTLDGEGRVVSCAPGEGGAAMCAGFKKGRVVSAPLRRNGLPIRAVMTVSTTSIISAL